MDPGRALQLEDLAKENLEKNKLMVVASTTKMDSKESASYYIRQQASDYTYAGQQRPQQIFDPLAWARFFQSMKKDKLSPKEQEMLRLLETEN